MEMSKKTTKKVKRIKKEDVHLCSFLYNLRPFNILQPIKWNHCWNIKHGNSFPDTSFHRKQFDTLIIICDIIWGIIFGQDLQENNPGVLEILDASAVEGGASVPYVKEQEIAVTSGHICCIEMVGGRSRKN